MRTVPYPLALVNAVRCGANSSQGFSARADSENEARRIVNQVNFCQDVWYVKIMQLLYTGPIALQAAFPARCQYPHQSTETGAAIARSDTRRTCHPLSASSSDMRSTVPRERVRALADL